MSRGAGKWLCPGALTQLALVTVIAAVLLAWQSVRLGGFTGLWLTPDQRGRLAYEQREFPTAFEYFEDPVWKGLAAYDAGLYAEAAAAFGRVPSAPAFFNRGNALMKSRDYGQAIAAFEQAVVEAPDWPEARENLDLARYVLDYIERAREASDTGEDTGIGADEIVFDNSSERGADMEISAESRVEIESAEKWMRAVDTDTRDFLRSRFQLEASRSRVP